MAYDIDGFFLKGGNQSAARPSVSTVAEAMAQSMEKQPEPEPEAPTDALKMVQAERAKDEAKEESHVNETDMTKGIGYQRRVTHTDSRTAGRKPAKGSDTCEIRGFPRSLIQMIKASNGCEDASNTMALAAFVYANRDMDSDVDYSDVPERVIELAGTFDRYKAAKQTDRNIRSINEKLKRIETDATSMVMGMAYLLYDRLGFRTDAPNTPSEVDFDLYGMAELFARMAESGQKYKKEKAYQDGRPL